MATKAQQKATAKYNEKAYERITLRVKMGNKSIIEDYAAEKGMSLNGYINKLIADDMGEALTVPEQGET
ncbi:MAG: antitoxin [Oscillospiraceae bacterium]|nr:antitoxin [Oscillospiraceae bacterium]